MDLNTIPVMPPPDGQTSDFNAPYNSLQITILVSFTVSYLFTTICLGLRFFQVFKLSKAIEADLVIITISYFGSLAYFITMVDLMQYAWGKHLWNISFPDFTKFMDRLLPNNLLYFITLFIIRTAMLQVLYRINPSRVYRAIIICIGIATFTYTLTFCIFISGPCNLAKLSSIPCVKKVTKTHAILNIVSDLAVMVMPIPTIHALRLVLKQKLIIGCILALGSGVVICSIARLPYVIVISELADPTYHEAVLGVWSLVEINLGIICVCVTRLRPLFTTYFPQLGTFLSRTRETGNKSPWVKQSNEDRSYQLHSIHKSCDALALERGPSCSETPDNMVERSSECNRSSEEILA